MMVMIDFGAGGRMDIHKTLQIWGQQVALRQSDNPQSQPEDECSTQQARTIVENVIHHSTDPRLVTDQEFADSLID